MKDAFYTSVDRKGNAIYFRGYQDGRPVKSYIKYKPTFFLPVKEKSKYKTLKGEDVKTFQPGSMGDCTQFLKQYSEFSNASAYGNERYINQFISDHFRDQCDWDRDLINVTTIDIEVQSDQGFPDPKYASHPITAITVKNNQDNVYYVWANGDWSKDKCEVNFSEEENIKYIKCINEKDILSKFLLHWINNYPDVITGWNSRLFDMTYIVNRIDRILSTGAMKQLSPWKSVSRGEIIMGGNEHHYYDIHGIQQLDYLDVFKKYGYTYGTPDSYKLDNIANIVLGEKKLDYSEYTSLNDLYKQNHQKFIDYNIRDVQVVDKIEEKTGLLTLAMTVAYKSLTNFKDAFGSVGMWDSIIYNELRRRNIVVPPKKVGDKQDGIEGAHVKLPINGMHEWVMSFDLNSLYPHIIMQYNMSPETIVPTKVADVTVNDLLTEKDYTIPEDLCMAGTGQCFSTTTQGIIPMLIDQLYKERVQMKNKQVSALKKLQEVGKDKALEKQAATFGNQQMAVKILMNSLYGALSNQYFKYFDQRIAEGITVTGQYTIRNAEQTVNRYLNKILKTQDVDYVIAIDTDSLYINFGPFVKKFYPDLPKEKILERLNQFGEEIAEPLLDKSYSKLKKRMNCTKQLMVMKREVIADKGIWTGKKHYMLNVLDSEGVRYKEPQVKMMGIEAVRSSTPMDVRKIIKETIKLIMEKDEKTVQAYIKKARKDFHNLKPEDAAFPRGVSNLDKYKDSSRIYRKSTPIHVRGALLYNYFIKELGIEKKYERIFAGDKIKFLYLKLPNRVKENVIAFSGVLPEEFNINDQIDYDTQFNKAYVEPLKNILDSIGWETEKRATLEDFF